MKTIRNISNEPKHIVVESTLDGTSEDVILSSGATWKVHNLFYCGKDFEEI